MIHVHFNNILLKIKGYIKENWGSPFIFTFIILLMGTAIFLSTGLSYMADTVVVYAFYALVVGVVLQFVSFLKPLKADETGAN